MSNVYEPCSPLPPSIKGGKLVVVVVVVVVEVVVGGVSGVQLSSLHFTSVSTQIQTEQPFGPILNSSPSLYHLPSNRHEYGTSSGCGISSGGCLNATVVPSTFSTLPFVAIIFDMN